MGRIVYRRLLVRWRPLPFQTVVGSVETSPRSSSSVTYFRTVLTLMPTWSPIHRRLGGHWWELLFKMPVYQDLQMDEDCYHVFENLVADKKSWPGYGMPLQGSTGITSRS